MKHSFRYCSLCEREMVVCGKCGNNTCNGGYGTLKDGSLCDACPSAYELDYDKENKTLCSKPAQDVG